MDWLLAGLLPEVFVRMVGVFDGYLVLDLKIHAADGMVHMYRTEIPLEDLREVLKGATNAAFK